MFVPNPPNLATLTIRALGTVTIALQSALVNTPGDSTPNEQRVEFETRTVDALLIYLACHGQPLSRDALAELFWPERTQQQARSNLRVALHRLRQPLAPYLSITRQTVALNLAAPLTLDIAQFATQLAAGQFAAAVALYRGDFLDGFYLDGSPAFEQWMLLERERLRTQAIATYQQLISQASTAGQLDSAIAAAQRLLQLDPLHEPIHRQLMRLLAQAGQRSAALTQYESCRQLLMAELAAPPDDATTVLAEQIRANDFRFAILDFRLPMPVADVDNPKSKIQNPKLHNLPPQPTPFIGRTAELVQVANLLANPDCRLLTLLGVGGIGKTRLALEAALHQRSHFADGVCLVPLAPVATAELVPVTIAQNLRIQSTSSDLKAEIAAYLQPRQLLLVLDNFEHLLAAADLLVYLLQNAAQVKVLVTSRERLNLREEWLLPVTGLAQHAGLQSEAGELFLRSAQRVQPGFTGSEQAPAIAAICRQVEGMPLALELAASWVRVMPCTEIAQQIGTNFDFLTTSLRNLPERHRSLRTLFDGSWRLLAPLEQGVLMGLSVFRGGWRLEEAAAVTGTTLATLLGLVDKSLVQVNAQNRFDLHELVRQYAAEQLTASGETDLMRQHHYAAYLQLFRTGDSHLRGPAAVPWFVRLAAEQDNLRTALQWSLDNAHYSDATWLLVAANWFWSHHGQWYEAARWVEPLLPHRHVLDPDLRLAFLIIFHAYALALEDAHPVARYRAEFLELLQSSSYKLLQSAAWAWVANYSADPAQSTAAHEQAIAAARTDSGSWSPGVEFCLFSDRDFLLGLTMYRYAAYLLQQGAVVRAAALATESFQFFAQRNRYERAFGLGMLGRLALLRSDLAQARALLQEAVQISIATHAEDLLGTWQPLLGRVMLYGGDAAEAHQLLHASLRLCIAMNNKSQLALVYTYLAETALWAGELEAAEQWLRQSLATSSAPAWVSLDEVQRLWVAARLATAQQQYPCAATLFGLADQAHRQIHNAIGGPMRALADAALATVQAALDPAAFAAAFAAGQGMTLAEAFTAPVSQTILSPMQSM